MRGAISKSCLHPDLFPYQQEGARWLASKRHALLADEMGLGKSAQAITAADLIGAERILVICPAVARINWMREFEKFSTRRFDLSISRLPPSGTDPVCAIVSYDYAMAQHELLSAWLSNDSLLILDEVHYLKNPAAKRTQSVLGTLAHKAQRVFALSGTPAPNNAAELWPLLYTVGVTALSASTFTAKHCISVWKGGRETIVGNQNIPELRALLQPFMMRRTKAEVLPQLPPLMITEFVVEPGEVDLEVHFADRDAVKELHLVRRELQHQQELVEATGKMTEYKHRLGAVEALVASVSTLRRYMGVQKAIPLAKLVAEELDEKAYSKIVIFCMHRAVIEELRYRLAKYKPVTLYGGSSPAARQKAIDTFQEKKHCKIFIGQIQAAGTAITLTAAHHVLFAEYDWVPSNNAQAMMRCHRIGQTQPVSVRFAVAAGAIDEIVLKVVRRKSKELAMIFDPVDIFA